jgi:RES domain-containing protein
VPSPPLSGAGARTVGGRWNPPDSFAILYVAVERETAVAEFLRMAARAGRAPEDFLPRRIYRYEARLTGLCDLRVAGARAALELTDDDLQSDDPSNCQAVGEAAEYLGREGIIAPSATGSGTVLAVFFDRLDPDSAIGVVDFETWEAAPEQ